MPTDPLQADPPKRKRRWFQFSLRAMMIVVTLFCAWMGIIASRANRQKRAAETITNAGGQVNYDFETDDDGWLHRAGAVPPGPDWLRNLIGIDYFATVVSVNIHVERPRNDDLFAALAELPGLKGLGLSGAGVTDVELARIKGLPPLRELSVSDISVTGGGWAPLECLANVRVLELEGAAVCDATLTHLGALTAMRELQLADTEVTDSGLKQLQVLTSLDSLGLFGNEKITATGMEQLQALPYLHLLSVFAGTGFTDAAVDRLKRALPNVWVDIDFR